ncbi:MAG TPA: thymidine phosphorylase [Bacteroidota bacterium]|nr:thymidine phosphorylase [Bacteroidota bacterium]
MNPREIIRKKRDGGQLSRQELEFFIKSYLASGVADYQMSAFLMACYFRGMDLDETTALTEVMLRSGAVVDLSSVPGIKVDKHSTGGVGDKVSLILAPMVAACGVPVPMISGRGLGHTGGTLDKLESIPGFRTNLSIQEYRAAIGEVGAVMAGQTAEIVPADMKMYALRDVTATVESVPLIAGSIMSKKLAEGIDALVLDVKVGRGAFMKTEADAVELAKTLIGIGKSFDKKVIGFLTDMSQPLGYAVGNWLEVKESLDCLKGRDVPDLMEITYLLGGAMLMLGGKATSIEEGTGLCRRAIESGTALDKFMQIVRRQGGDVSYLEDFRKYPASKFMIEIRSPSAGDIDNVDALELGLAAIMLGAGRMKLEDGIDPKAGIVLRKKAGDAVEIGEPLAALFTDSESAAKEARPRVERAFSIATEPSVFPRLIHSMVDDRGVHPWPLVNARK